nr:hypothetical protein BaRGS_031102 [Batillaria attramentaria]
MIAKENARKNYSVEWNANLTATGGPYNLTVRLPEEGAARLYAIILEVHDKAGNVNYARRLVLYDNTSTVELKPSASLQVVSANTRFYNSDLYNTNFLMPVKTDTGREIYGDYDQQSGILPITGTDNVIGITKFEEENVRVSIDHTGPSVSIEGLRGRFGRDGLYVHNTTDLSSMLLLVRAADPHSGIKTLEWTLGTRDLAADLGNGALGVNRLGNAMIDILIDESPPTVGVVLEGLSDDDRAEMDFTSSDVVHVRWHGFLDHESGILLYRVVLADRCLTDEEMDAADNATEVEGDNMATIRFPSEDYLRLTWAFEDEESEMEEYHVGMGRDRTTASAPDLLPFTPTHGHHSYHARHSGLGHGAVFFVFLRALSKAGLQVQLTLGPVIIDVTPPDVTQLLTAEVDGDFLVTKWNKHVFKDSEQPAGVEFDVTYRVG